MEQGKEYKQRVVSENIPTIDKRQYMRFSTDDNPTITFTPSDKISSLVDISRGGVAVRHDGDLKVGDIVPVNIRVADMDINADVKVISASSTRAGAEFVNLDETTADRLLYMNMLFQGNPNSLSMK